jgi:hypothetical protein
MLALWIIMVKAVLSALVVGCAVVVIAGCGEDEAPLDPRQSCADFLDAWCNKNAECALPTERARVREDCGFVVELDVDCTKVQAVSANYSGCIDAILASTCTSPDGIALPSLCRGVLLR